MIHLSVFINILVERQNLLKRANGDSREPLYLTGRVPREVVLSSRSRHYEEAEHLAKHFMFS